MARRKVREDKKVKNESDDQTIVEMTTIDHDDVDDVTEEDVLVVASRGHATPGVAKYATPGVAEMSMMQMLANTKLSTSVMEQYLTKKYGLTRADFAPSWTRAVHRKIGRIGGAVLFGLMVMLVWPLIMVAVAALVQVMAQNVFTQIPVVIAQTFNVPPSVLTSSMDQFYFSWLTPTWFCTAAAFVLLMGVVVWALRRARHMTIRVGNGLMVTPLRDDIR